MSEINYKGIYRHFKGGLYDVLYTTAIHTETNETLVIYKEIATGKIYARPHAMFFDKVILNDNLVNRFEKVLPNKN